MQNIDSRLLSTWLAFMGGGLHPALKSGEAERPHLETLGTKILPLVLNKSNSHSKLARSVATSILTNILLQPIIGIYQL